MEEVDRIILHFFRQLGVNIDPNLKKIDELTVDNILQSVSKCLTCINPGFDVIENVPTGVSQRIEMAAQFAHLCKELGYKNDVGYQTFLYYNESDLRKVFMFLIESLPIRETISPIKIVSVDEKDVYMTNIKNKIGEELKRFWTPPSLKHKSKKNTKENLTLIKYGESWCKLKDFFSDKNNTNEVMFSDVHNSKGLVAYDAIQKDNISTNKNDQELKREIIILKEVLKNISSEKHEMNQELKKMNQKELRLSKDIEEMKSLNQLKSELVTNEKKGVPFLIIKLKSDLQRLSALSDEWTQKNINMKLDIDERKTFLCSKETERSKRESCIQSLRMSIKNTKEDYKKYEMIKYDLKKQYDRMSSTGAKNRTSYTKKIMDIMISEDKQNKEIEKIITDTKTMQQDVDQLKAQLHRTYAFIDEQLSKDSKGDVASERIHQMLLALHSECCTIIKCVSTTGLTTSEIIDLEDHINVEKTKRIVEILSRVKADLNEIHRELHEKVESVNV